VAELRWLLLLIGICVIGAVYLYTRFKPHGGDDHAGTGSMRKEPRIAPLDSASGEESVELSAPVIGPSEAVPAVAPAPQLVVAIRLMPSGGARFSAEKLILDLRELGLRHGQYGIFHLLDNDDGRAVFSVASLVEPGSFDLTKIKTESYPGVSMFLALPGPRDGPAAFDDMLNVARKLAERLDGQLLDEQGNRLSIQRERYMREEIIQFEHLGKG